MHRKPAILIALILLLLIGGGGVVFYLHLRKETALQFSQVDQFLRQAPFSGNWVLARTDEEVFTVATGARWMQSLGIHHIKQLPRNRYVFSDPRGTAFVVVTVTHDSQRITDLMVLGQPADAGIFLRHLLEKFPCLQRFVPSHPHGPPP